MKEIGHCTVFWHVKEEGKRREQKEEELPMQCPVKKIVSHATLIPR